MIHLFIDTSQPYLILAVKNGPSIFQTIIRHENSLGALLSQEVTHLLEKASVGFKDLEEIRIGVGPGSYTGTRVGVAFAESLGFGLNIPVIKLPSLVFFLQKGEKELIIKSKFNTIGLLKVNGPLWDYQVLSQETLAYAHARLLDPSTKAPEPDFELLAILETPTPLQNLLYFNRI